MFTNLSMNELIFTDYADINLYPSIKKIGL